MTDLDILRQDCTIASTFWGRIFAAALAVTNREKGEQAASELIVRILQEHQTGHYHEGLRRLGISESEPPAVIAAKYHYLSNAIGGLSMEYVEESPRKVWIRYTAPMWTFAGIGMLAIPGSVRRSTFNAWHPRNGKMMGCPRLGWVSTKFIMEGEPYDEGYFIEYDHDLAPGEEFRYEPVAVTPEFDPDKAPRLDPALWPEARRLKATRNFSRGYARTSAECLYRLFGEQTALFLIRQMMRGVAIQFTHELKREAGIDGKDAGAVTAFLARVLQACGQDHSVETLSPEKHRIHLRSFLPFEPDAGAPLREAWFEFPVMAARIINGRVGLSRLADGTGEIWEIEDKGRWLW